MAQFNQPQAANSIFNIQQKAAPPMYSPPPQGSNFNLFNSFTSGSQPSSKAATPIPSTSQQQQQQQQHANSLDPFASLATSSRQPSPFQPAPSKAPAPSSQPVDLLGISNSNGTAAATTAPTSSHDDEWEFSSALPDQPTEITVTNSPIRTIFAVSRSGDTELLIQSRISNSTPQPVSDLTFQLAVTKVCGTRVKMDPPTYADRTTLGVRA
jgi:hypothetical protein